MVNMIFSVVVILLMSTSDSFKFNSRIIQFGHMTGSKQMYELSSTTNVLKADDGKLKPYSFVQDDLRTYAMKLHTRDQSPKEGQQKAQVPFSAWQPGRIHYVQFLVDSLKVYETLESLVQTIPELAPFKYTGLERTKALKDDLKWFTEYDKTLTIPACGPNGIAYSEFLTNLATESIPKFMCHYYNHYFAHTAGGKMIGKRMSDLLLDGFVINFYKWESDEKVNIQYVTLRLKIINYFITTLVYDSFCYIFLHFSQ